MKFKQTVRIFLSKEVLKGKITINSAISSKFNNEKKINSPTYLALETY